jgi:pseudouridine synthase
VLIAFNKPFGVLSQFTPNGSANRTLAEFGFPKDVYAIGRLDADSEGLLLLSNEPELNQKLLHPKQAHEREYWVQLERIPERDALRRLEKGVSIQGRRTLACRAWILEPQPELSQERADLLDRIGTGGRKKPSGPADDRSHWTSNPAARASQNRAIRSGRASDRDLETSCT